MPSDRPIVYRTITLSAGQAPNGRPAEARVTSVVKPLGAVSRAASDSGDASVAGRVSSVSLPAAVHAAVPAALSMTRTSAKADARVRGDAVVTILTPLERERVDAAGEGCYTALHRESIDQVLVELRTQRISAVLLSVSCYSTQQAPGMARLVREFPRVPAVALLTAHEPRTTQSLLALGQHGVRALVDVRDPQGWRDLRKLVTTERGESIEHVAIARINNDLPGASPDCYRFFEALFTAPARVTTVRQLTRQLGIVPSTFMSRFYRVGLPAPKRYLATARLVRAARLFENPGLSISHVANHLEYSSPQSFSRHVSTLLGVTAGDFRDRYSGDAMLDEMRRTLVLPYTEALRAFEPFVVVPQWSVLRRRV